jgi:hypothetical protein
LVISTWHLVKPGPDEKRKKKMEAVLTSSC